MTDSPRQVLRILANRIHQLFASNKTTTIIERISGKTQQKLGVIRNIALAKYEAVAKDFVHANSQPTPLPRNLVHWWQWYQKLTGLDAVELAKQEVTTVQEKLFKCQEDRRVLHRQAININEKLKEIYGELIQTKREDPKYVHLTIMENKGLQEQGLLNRQLMLLENEEKDHFTQLATAIKEYHDSQALNAQRYKYFSILASALLTIISLVSSMIYNNRRIMDVRNVISNESVENKALITKCFDSLETSFNTKLTELSGKIEKKENNARDIKSIVEATSAPIDSNTNNKFIIFGGAVLVYCLLKMIT